jgi:hypothetical protein
LFVFLLLSAFKILLIPEKNVSLSIYLNDFNFKIYLDSVNNSDRTIDFDRFGKVDLELGCVLTEIASHDSNAAVSENLRLG